MTAASPASANRNALGRTKAEVLEYLASRVRGARLLPLFYFSVGEWQADRVGVLRRLGQQSWCHDGPLAIRSSAFGEDGMHGSNAGRFTSVLGVDLGQAPHAIERVIASYVPKQPADQVLVQPMARNIRSAGVATSREPGSGRPYVVVNWCHGDDPSAITSGRADRDEVWYWYRNAERPAPGQELKAVIALVFEVEELLSIADIDVEFVFAEGGLTLLQARPLVGLEQHGWPPELERELLRCEGLIKERLKPHPALGGRSTCFSVMTDWNPAEIIGRRPRPLAASLYRELVTDQVWANQRVDYGYRDVRGFPLLVTLAGQPFVDVRVSLNSFVPAALSDALAHKLVDHWLDQLSAHPSHHDKVEFEVVLSANSLDLPERLGQLRDAGFTESECEELERSLQQLTNAMLAEGGPWHLDRRRIEDLPQRRRAILESDLSKSSKIVALLEDCRHFGTLAFAGMARVGFVAVQILRSMTSTGLLAPEASERFFAQLNTASQVITDFRSLSADEFVRRHGHLRPGTYDILKATYGEAYDEYFADSSPPPSAAPSGTASLLLGEDPERVSRALSSRGFAIGAADLDRFLRTAIEGRESAKWEFTRSLSSILQLIESLGQEYGLSREDCSFLTVSNIKRTYDSTEDIGALFASSVAYGRARYKLNAAAALPPLIFEPHQVWGFAALDGEPTYLTRRVGRGPVAVEPDGGRAANGCIVLIRSADPGYDWLFCHSIAGLITAYGGANSHMAIRAAELGIPAAIGVGEEVFEDLATARMLELDCANCKIRRLQ